MQEPCEITGKLAALEVRNLAYLRNKVKGLIAPLACTVDYFGVRFLCLSEMPLSINSLIYGSDTAGILFENESHLGEEMAQKTAKLCNLKPHYVRERVTQKIKQTYLPFDIQLHRDVTDGTPPLGQQVAYVFNTVRLFAREESLRTDL